MLEDRAERYLIAHIQRTVLEAELAEYERKHASPAAGRGGPAAGGPDRRPIRRPADETVGRHEVAGGRHGRGEIRTAAELSEGTADQAFVALRLAGVAALQEECRAAGVPTLPVVLDDVLMTFDDERAAAALRVMARLAQRWQVIVLSHHLHLADVVASLDNSDITVSHLRPPDALHPTRCPDAIRALAAVSGGDGAELPTVTRSQPLTDPMTPPGTIRA